MLTHIQIRDFVIIDAIELELDAGLTVLTGETGAGKSILVDALLLASGGRAGAEVVRHGAERAEVTATFSLSQNTAALAWFKEQEIDCDDECVLRRTVTSDGRSRAYVNGQAVAVQSLRQLGERLVDIHGQMEYQSLMRRGAQRELLDQYGAYSEQLDATAEAWRKLKSIRESQAQAQAANQDRAARLELLRYHVTELRALDLKPGEVTELVAERQRVAQGGRLAEGAREALLALRDAEVGSAESTLAKTLATIRQLSAFDAKLNPISASLDESLIALREAVEALGRYEDGLDVDPARQEWLEARLAAVESLARKHRVEAEALTELSERMSQELESLENLGQTLDQLDAALAEANKLFLLEARKLSALRTKTAAGLAERVTSLMQGLGMPGGRFAISLTERDPATASEHGLDDVEFLVSANPGQPAQPLAKTASGGELSRISLAIQVAAVESFRQPCLVFDEVDAGVGGGVAEIVGRQLRALGSANDGRAQVLCVTHLPQVAAQAHAHVRVVKLTDGKTTRTSLNRLSEDERAEEIARMLGGVSISATAREHAVEMLSAARSKDSQTDTRKRSKKR